MKALDLYRTYLDRVDLIPLTTENIGGFVNRDRRAPLKKVTKVIFSDESQIFIVENNHVYMVESWRRMVT